MKKFLFLLSIFFSLNSFSQTATISIWKDSVIGAIWNGATSTVAYNKKDSKGNFKIYLSDSLGNNEQALTFSGWRNDRQQYSSGIIHSAVSPDGTMFAWSERVRSPKFTDMNLAAGGYVFRVADFVFDSVPHFTNIRTFQPGGVLAGNELEGISNDNRTLSFYSTFETKSLFRTPIYTMNIITGKITRLTQESFAQAPTFTPDGSKIVYMTGQECDIFPLQVQGADWWVMDTDGSNKKRLTYMNKRNDPQSVNRYRLAGSISFISNHSFFGGVMTKSLGLTGYTVKVVFK